MAGVKSVEKFSITLAVGDGSEDATLNLGQNRLNCVPFITKQVTTETDGAADDWKEYLVEAWFPTGTTVRVETEEFDSRGLIVEVTVVEFDPDDVRVQQDVYLMADTETSDVVTLAEEVVEGNTFLYHTWRGGNGDDNESCAVRGQLTSTAVTLDRALSVNAINGRCYVVESLSGDFTVQSDSITLTDPDTETTATLTTTAPVAKTFLVGSMKTTNGVSGDNNRTIPYIQLQDEDTIHLLRESGAFGVIAEVFTITFNAGGAENVQRGVHVQSTPTDDEAIELPAPVGTLSTSMVMTPSNGTFKNGALDGSGSNDNPDSQCALTFVDDSNIRFEKSIHGVDPTARWSWEVIEWELSAGGSTRRVMVIS